MVNITMEENTNKNNKSAIVHIEPEVLDLPNEQKRDIISQNVVKLSTNLQKAVNKLVDFFDEASAKEHDYVSKTQLETVFPKRYEKLFNNALDELVSLHVLGVIPFMEFTMDDNGNCSVIDNVAYSLTLTSSKVKNIPQEALNQSLVKMMALKTNMFHNPEEGLFSFENVQNLGAIKKEQLDIATHYALNKDRTVELTYFIMRRNSIIKEKGYFIAKYAFDELKKCGEKFNDIYIGKEELLNESIKKEYDYIVTPETGFKNTYVFSPKEIYYLAKTIVSNADSYGRVMHIIGERAIQLYDLVPADVIERIENEKSSKKENLVLDEISTAASKFFENYKDIISESALIDALAQATSKNRELIQKAFSRFSNKIRKCPFQEKDRVVVYYAGIDSLLNIMHSVKDISIKMEYIRLYTSVSMLEELFERVKLNKMDKKSLATLLKVSVSSLDDIKKEADIERKRLSEKGARYKPTERREGFFKRLFSFLFGSTAKKKSGSEENFNIERTPEQKERAFINKMIKEVLSFFSRYKRPAEIKKFPDSLVSNFNNDYDELKSFLNRLVGDQVLRRIRISNKKIGTIEYFVPFNFLSNPKKYEDMVSQIKSREKFIDIKEELLDTLMKEYSTIQGKIKK